MHGALAAIERYCEGRGAKSWLVGSALSQADITVSCAFTFLRESLRADDLSARYPRLAALVDLRETLAAFKNTHTPFFSPGGQ
jgi:glutathione S-transferase